MQIENNIIENKFVEMLCRNFRRSEMQMNKLNESDAEIIAIPGTKIKLAVTTDNISEEIEKGLYTDPYQVGYMSVLVNASDIAAVGAEPAGVLLNQTFKEGTSQKYIDEIQRGVNDACNETGFYVLGGDTNFSATPQFGAAAIGFINDDKVISRKGCEEGDIVYTSGKLGSGNAYAFSRIFNSGEIDYKPKSRIKQGQLIRKYASCCMDTSDGVLATLDQLMRINNIGFEIDANPEEYIDSTAIELSNKINKSPLIMLAGQHGEFELIFTVPQLNNYEFYCETGKAGWNPLRIGYVKKEACVTIKNNDDMFKPDTGKIRNLFTETGGNVENYIKELFKLFNF